MGRLALTARDAPRDRGRTARRRKAGRHARRAVGDHGPRDLPSTMPSPAAIGVREVLFDRVAGLTAAAYAGLGPCRGGALADRRRGEHGDGPRRQLQRAEQSRQPAADDRRHRRCRSSSAENAHRGSSIFLSHRRAGPWKGVPATPTSRPMTDTARPAIIDPRLPSPARCSWQLAAAGRGRRLRRLRPDRARRQHAGAGAALRDDRSAAAGSPIRAST